MTAGHDSRKGCYRPCRAVLLLLAVLGCAASVYGYLPDIDSSGGLVRWPTNSVVYQISLNLSGSQFSSDDSTKNAITAAMQAAFSAWTSAPNTSLSVSQSNAALPNPLIAHDGHNVICFNCQDATAFGSNQGTETLAVTDVAYQITGHGTYLYDADMLFNPAVKFVLPPTAGAADGSTISLQSVATHEAGHFFGLDHSAVLRAVMFPYISSLLTTLSYDDVAAISLLYPKATADYATGSLSGTISLASNGSGVYGAHVYASSSTGNAVSGSFNIRPTPIGILSRPDGTYSINGLPPDSYSVTVEPLDGPVQDSNIGWYDTGSLSVQTTFNTRWH